MIVTYDSSFIKSWFLSRVSTGIFILKKTNGNGNAIPHSSPSKSNRFSKLAKLIYIPIGILRLHYFKIKLKGYLKNKTLYIGFKHHNIRNGNYNIYLHPFFTPQNGEIFYLDQIQNDKQLAKFYQDVIIFYSLLFKIGIYKKNFPDISKQVITELKNEVNFPVEELEKNLAQVFNSYPIQKKIASLFLKVLKPDKLFCYCYYDTSVNAFISAANDMGMHTIEYQHSVLSDIHHAYYKWQNIDDLRTHFPSEFYVWGNDEKKVIEKNIQTQNFKPEITVVGNRFLEIEREKNEIKITNNKKYILVCLQGIWIPEFLETFIAEDTHYTWYFRLHPRYHNDKEKLNKLHLANPIHVEKEDSNKRELYDLFNISSLVITSFSGVALEAEHFGLPVAIFGKVGFDVYKNKIEESKFSYIYNKDTFHKVLLNAGLHKTKI